MKNADRAMLRKAGHHLRPAIMIGRSGLDERVERACDINLNQSELIKGRVLEGSGLESKQVAAELAAKTQSVVVQVIGHNFLLFKQKVKESKFNIH